MEGAEALKDAIDSTLILAKKKHMEISTHLVDLEKDSFIKKENYDVIICFNFLQQSLISNMKRKLRPGSVIVYETCFD